MSNMMSDEEIMRNLSEDQRSIWERAKYDLDMQRADVGAHPNAVLAILRALAALARECDELRAVVEKLPTWADGTPIVPGTTGYCPSGHPVTLAPMQKMVTCQHAYCYDDTIGDKHQIRYEVARCYSSREAALAAAGSPPRRET